MTQRICAVPNCQRPSQTREWCGAHYQRWRYSGDVKADVPIGGLSRLERFMAKVRKTETCWLWTASLSWDGYGKFDRVFGAHRVAYELLVGPIPHGLQVDHLCRVRHCVNPAHLEAVTARENSLRSQNMSAANARKTHCKRGHPFDAANTHITVAGTRKCRICHNELARLSRLRVKERGSQ